MKSYEETLNYIHSLGMFSHVAGLDRMTELLNRLDNPQHSIYAVHIAGTNGKGSTAAMITSALRCAGLKTGTFISPYIIDFCERIQINGEFIPRDTLVRLANRVREAGVAVTEFEFITAIGFLYFKECGCDICVCETGLGGRLDATNTLVDKLPVITKIGLDHTAVLGDTLSQIAAEKCGIIRGNTAVTCPWQHDEALCVIKEKAPHLTLADEGELEILSVSLLGNRFRYKGHEYKTSLGGMHQIQNALTAIETLGALRMNIPHEAIVEGLEKASFPARLEVVSQSPLVVLDGAHNPDGGEVLKSAMRPYSGKITAIVGMMRDKNADEFLRAVLPECKNVIAVSVAENPRTLDAEELKAFAAMRCDSVMTAESYSDAVLKAKSLSGDDPIFVFGSLYLASGIRNLLIKTFSDRL